MEAAAELHKLVNYTPELFQPLVGLQVPFLRPPAVDGTREEVCLDVIRVTASKLPPAAGFRRQFSVLFGLREAAPLDHYLLHALVHRDFEPCDLLLNRVVVPELRTTDGTMFYELVIA